MKSIFAYIGFSLLIVFIVFTSGCVEAEEINSFEECVAAGYPVMESYPAQCRIPDGKTFTQVIENNQNIGGERDEHGCLGTAGYSWNESIGACLREWELDSSQKKAAKIAVDYTGRSYGTTILEVLTARCPGCFSVKIEKGVDGDIITLYLNNWTISEKSVNMHVCTEEEKNAEICTLEYAPVCGFKEGESKTYGNGCQACADESEYWTIGVCEEEDNALSPQECETLGGRNVNIVGGETCRENETNAGNVVGFISPNICCVPE